MSGIRTRGVRLNTLLLCVVSAVGCGGEIAVAPMAPSDDAPGAAGNVVTISSTGASPLTIQISVGERVLFVNNDSVVHEMVAGPHPSHLACPEMNQVGSLSPGQSRETGNFVMAETCTYHDHLDALNPGLLGSIVIVE